MDSANLNGGDICSLQIWPYDRVELIRLSSNQKLLQKVLQSVEDPIATSAPFLDPFGAGDWRGSQPAPWNLQQLEMGNGWKWKMSLSPHQASFPETSETSQRHTLHLEGRVVWGVPQLPENQAILLHYTARWFWSVSACKSDLANLRLQHAATLDPRFKQQPSQKKHSKLGLYMLSFAHFWHT